MKKELLYYLNNNIPIRIKDLITIQYCEFVNGKKIPFVKKFVTDYKIIKFPIFNQWFGNIFENKNNHVIIINFIEDQTETFGNDGDNLNIIMKQR